MFKRIKNLLEISKYAVEDTDTPRLVRAKKRKKPKKRMAKIVDYNPLDDFPEEV